MNYCVKCGAQVPDGVSICPQCGAVIPGAYENQEYTYGQEYTYSQDFTEVSRPGCFSESEVKKNKGMAVISYLGILVLIPILAGDRTSSYLKQHMNQGFVLFILNAVIGVAEEIAEHVFFIGGMLSWAVDVVDFALFIIMIMGIVSACKETLQPLPIIGKVEIFK